MPIEPLSRKQRHTYASFTHRINIAIGAVRSGKTIGVDFAFMRRVRDAPPNVDILMIGKTERTLRRNVINPMINMLGNSRARYVAGEGELYLFGRRIYCVGANDEGAENKIRGMSLWLAYGDEMTIWPESFWSMLKTRLSVPGAQFFGTTNPSTPAHWLKREIDCAEHFYTREGDYLHRDPMLDTTLAGWIVIDYKLEDNEYLMRTNPEYVESLKRELTGVWYRRFILGEWIAADGAIYPMWNPDEMVVSMVPAIETVICDGIDYGTDHPTAGVTLCLGVDGVLYLTREWSPRKGSSDAELVRDFAGWRRMRALEPRADGEGREPAYTFVDPAAASLKRELTVMQYPRVLNGHNTPVTDGVRTVGALLDRGLLKVHVDCLNLIREIGSYVWDDAASKRGKDEPVKINDDWCDGMRYAVFSSRAIWLPRLRERMTLDVTASE